jgi:predicted  nucleic acid-binding Zn-ribbon protein
LNKELAEVGAKSGKVPAKAKAAFTKAMQDVKKQQNEVAKDIAAFDKATLETFKTLNAKLQSDLAVLKNKIRAARAKIPS